MKSKIFALILIVSLAAASCGRPGGHSRNH